MSKSYAASDAASTITKLRNARERRCVHAVWGNINFRSARHLRESLKALPHRKRSVAAGSDPAICRGDLRYGDVT
jgi:hypothetical protein